MKKKILIIGAGNHAKVLFSEIIKLKKYNIVGFVDDKKRKKIQFKFKNKVYHYLGNFKEFLNKNNNKNLSLIIAIGSNYSRKKCTILLKENLKN